MNELEFNELVDKAVKECRWRQDSKLGVVICRSDCLPCKRCIDIGRCDTIKDLIKKIEKENKNKNE